MKKLYDMIIITKVGFRKEITLPSGKYHINNNNTIESNESLIPLSLPIPDSLLHRIEAELYENYYCVSCTTKNNEFITINVSYNTLFSYQGIPFFAIKEQHETWNKNIMPAKEKTSNSLFLMKYTLCAILILPAILIAGFIREKNSTHHHKDITDYRKIIYSQTNSNEFLIKENKMLILTSNENGIKKIKKEYPDYIIHAFDKKKSRISKDDIIMTPDFNKKKEIIYIYQKNTDINSETLSIPSEFKDDVTIIALSFNDITRLINNRFSQHSFRYSVKKSDNNIFIYADKRRDKETDNIIKDINTTIFSSPGYTLVQYRETPSREIHPGVYGSLNYIHLSDNHKKIISDNK